MRVSERFKKELGGRGGEEGRKGEAGRERESQIERKGGRELMFATDRFREEERKEGRRVGHTHTNTHTHTHTHRRQSSAKPKRQSLYVSSGQKKKSALNCIINCKVTVSDFVDFLVPDMSPQQSESPRPSQVLMYHTHTHTRTPPTE